MIEGDGDAFGPFRKRLRQIRTDRGMTQAAMAKRLGVPDATISHYETGFRTPTVRSLARISDTFGVSMNWLMGMREW